MKKIFISIPPDFEAMRDTFTALVKDYLRDSIETETNINLFNSEPTPLDKLNEHIQQIKKADYVIFAGDWADNFMCRIECICAVNYDKNILEITGGVINVW